MFQVIRVIIEDLPKDYTLFLNAFFGIAGVVLGAFLSKIIQKSILKQEQKIRYREEKFDVYSQHIVMGFFKEFDEKNHREKDCVIAIYLNQLRTDFRFLPRDIQRDFVKHFSGKPKYFECYPHKSLYQHYKSPYPLEKREGIIEWCQNTWDIIQAEYNHMLQELYEK